VLDFFRDGAIGVDGFLPSGCAAEAARFELGAEAAIDAFRDATGGDFRFVFRNFVDDEFPGLARFGAGLAAKAAARDEHHRLRVGVAFMHDGRVLARGLAGGARAVAPLGRDEMFNAKFMAHKMHADPVRQVEPLPIEGELANRRMFGKKDAFFPTRRRLARSFFAADCGARRICDITPRADDFQEFERGHVSAPRS
jgi:hypothetical protein